MTEPSHCRAEDQQSYERLRRLGDIARQDVDRRIRATLDALGDPVLIRAVSAPARVKSLSSLIRKARQQNWSVLEAFGKAQDFVGCRLVCNNLQDALRAADLLQSSLEQDGFGVRRKDLISRPSRDGYRALHLIFSVPVRIGEDEANLGCEIQVRSLLQDAWAQLSRADIYSSLTSAPIRRRMAKLSRLLAGADAEADLIRTELSRPRRGRKPPAGSPLTASSVAFLYRRAFGIDAEEYFVQSILREFGSFQIRSDGLEAVLLDTEYMSRLKAEYESHTRWETNPVQHFRWAVWSMVYGPEAGLKQARRDGEQDWQEIDTVARSEMMASLPDTVDDLLDELRFPAKDGDPQYDIEHWASALGAVRTCGCGETIVDAEVFAENAVSHYKIRGKHADEVRDEVEAEITNSGVETGGWMNSSRCSYCDHILSKDD